jgi:hypothetical protein
VAGNATMWYQSNFVELLVMGTLQSGIRAVKKKVLCGVERFCYKVVSEPSFPQPGVSRFGDGKMVKC